MKKSFWQVSVLVSAALVMSSCGPKGGKGTNPQPQPSTVTEIRGDIEPLPAGTTLVKDNENAGQGLGISAAVQSDGNFALKLPNISDMEGKYQPLLFDVPAVFGCDSASVIKNTASADVKLYPINYLATNNGQILKSTIDGSTTTDNYRGYWYSNKDIKLEFKGKCSLADVDTVLDLKKGWNVVDNSIKLGKSATYAVNKSPATKFIWKVDNAAMNGQGLGMNILTPWRNLPQYRNR